MAIIDKPSDYFSAQTWTGTGNAQNITGVDFQPDLVITKAQYATSQGYFFDVVRGATKFIAAQTDAAQTTDVQSLKSFNSDGYSIGTANEVSYNGETWVGWSWKAGTSFTNDASATGIGSIDSAGSVNTDAGISIITYTGTGSAETIAHGLGATPGFIISRRIDGTDSWMNWNKTFTATQYMFINGTNAVASASTVFGTLPTSTVYSTGGGTATGANGGNFISYCFAEKQGYSKFGSYTGNDNADGTFVYLGFKPAFVMIKRTNSVNNWIVLDNKRNPFNVLNLQSHLNTTASATNTTSLDFLSNGMKMRATYGGINGDNDNFIYMAFAENPFVTSTGNGSIPATAR